MVVRTTLGIVRGKLVDDEITGAYYYSFEGIPYAEPPVGKLRFKPPVRKRPWSSVLDATTPGCVCPQPEGIYYSKYQMDEDCLKFNIYTPVNCFNNLLPVVFIIHGGDFDSLSGNAKPIYGPQLLIQNDLVVVTMNYRLGALGFLSLCTEEVSGNAGLKDVILVLKIVHENIARFGGDPNKITIMGNGAGAAMAELLMLTKQCTGLFQNVILQSGSVLSSKYTQIYPRENAILLGRKLGLNLSNDECFIDELRLASAFEIVQAQEAISRQNKQRGFIDFKPFKPTVEIDCDSAVLTRPPLELIREGAICDVPMLIGFNNQEGVEIFPLLEEEPELIEKLNENFELLIPSDIQYPYGSVEREKLADCIREFYFNGGNISFVDVQNYVDLISDAQYTFSIDFLVRLYRETKNAPIYYYIFTADTELNWYKAIYEITYPGAAHFDDIGYVFLTEITEPKYECLDSITKHIQDNVLLNLKYFIYYGIPTPNPNTNYWPEAGYFGYHIIQDYDAIAVFNRPLPERIGFWNSVYEEYFNFKCNVSTYFCTNDNICSIV